MHSADYAVARYLSVCLIIIIIIIISLLKTHVRRTCSQCSTLVRNTVVRAIHTVNGRVGNSTPRGSKTPEPIEMKLYMVDYVTHPTPHAQFG